MTARGRAISPATPTGAPPAPRQPDRDAQHGTAGAGGPDLVIAGRVARYRGDDLTGAGQSTSDDHARIARPRQNAPDTHTAAAGAGQSQSDIQLPRARPHDSLLLVYADMLDGLESPRIAAGNRRHALDAKGLGDAPEAAELDETLALVAAAEKRATRALERAMRAHPLGPWVERTRGVGLKQAGRLLAAIGDPYWNAAEDRPRRGPAELWAYCGLHNVPAGQPPSDDQGTSAGGGENVAARRVKGQRANWNAAAKMRAYLVAKSCIKQRESPYREDYDRAREKAAAAVHARPCPRCGPSGSPAPAGSPLSDGHKHARALRAVSKAILRDLWKEARDVGGHYDHDDQHDIAADRAIETPTPNGEAPGRAGDNGRQRETDAQPLRAPAPPDHHRADAQAHGVGGR